MAAKPLAKLSGSAEHVLVARVAAALAAYRGQDRATSEDHSAAVRLLSARNGPLARVNEAAESVVDVLTMIA
jgi:hypothetical protein